MGGASLYPRFDTAQAGGVEPGLDFGFPGKILAAMSQASVVFCAGLWAAAGGLSGWGGVLAEPETDAGAGQWEALRAATFEEVWRTVNDSYYDPTFGGVDWGAVGERYRATLPGAADNEVLRKLLQSMLGELRQSHFSILPREMAVFAPEERGRVGAAGADVVYADGVVAVATVESDSAAQQAGLVPGDVVLQMGGVLLAPLEGWLERTEMPLARRSYYLTQWVAGRLQGPVGSTLGLQVRGADGQVREVAVTFAHHAGLWSEPVGNFPSMPIRVRSWCDPDGVAYLRFNFFARESMKEVRSLLSQVPADGGLVIDLRGNAGGLAAMAAGISGWLSDRPFQLGTMHLRQGHLGYSVFPQPGAFLGPVALLIDSTSLSTSEIMAAGLQEAGRARIFGAASPGAALPSLFKSLPTGDKLQYAVADLQTPAGKLIEGRGVTPDEPVGVSVADLAAGRDPVLDAALRWLRDRLAIAPSREPSP